MWSMTGECVFSDFLHLRLSVAVICDSGLCFDPWNSECLSLSDQQFQQLRHFHLLFDTPLTKPMVRKIRFVKFYHSTTTYQSSVQNSVDQIIYFRAITLKF